MNQPINKGQHLHELVTDIFVSTAEQMLERATTEQHKPLEEREKIDTYASSQVLSSMTKFLKDNEIQFQNDSLDDLKNLKKSLARKSKALKKVKKEAKSNIVPMGIRPS